jgi:conjugative relaxase-like TrwC/TraI family protein
MFTMAKIRDGSTYLGNHLSANDYYAEGEKVCGRWVGRGAEFLGLRGEVMQDAFEAVRCNLNPDTRGPLTPRRQLDRVAFFDFQCSAQKSVSLMAILGGDERMRAAHEQAAMTAFAELEQFAARQQNTRKVRQSATTGNVCAAAFVHDASRALDPQLHTHFVVANATRDDKGRWVALNEFEMVKAIRYAGKVYQNELARAVKNLGYEVREMRDNRGQVTGFEIEGIGDDLCQRFSKRRAEIESEIARFQEDRGRTPTTAEIGQITRKTRSAKLSEISTPAVRSQQLSQLTTEERKRFRTLKEQAFANLLGHAPSGEESQALQASVDHLFERCSVAKEHEVLAEALNQALGSIDLEVLKGKLERTEAGLVRLNVEAALRSEWATHRGLQLEQWAVEFVDATRGTVPPLNSDFIAGPSLSEEQRAAVHAILSTKDRVFSFRGVAGAGKTTALREVQRGLAKHRVQFLAPTVAAVKVLQGEGFSNATTVEDFLQSGSRRGALRDTVVICDEAGLKSNRQGAELLRLAKLHGMRVLLVGDVRQHVSVEAGDFLRVLEAHSQLGRCEVAEIRRQQSVPAYRSAIEKMATGDARGGLEAMDAMGWLKEGRYLQAAADEFLLLAEAGLDRCLAVAPTWQENHRFTEAIRAGLKTRGNLGESIHREVFDSLSWTTQQKRNPSNYAAGQKVVFSRTNGTWRPGDVAEVRRIEGKTIIVSTAAGGERKLALRAAHVFDVGQPRMIEIATGDKVLVRANRKKLGLNNGQVLTVRGIDADGALLTREGPTISATFHQWCHGYVVTSHKAQGRTFEHVVVAAERLDAKSAYVACSRGRKSCSVHIPDKQRLIERLQDGNRRAALDVLAEAHPIVSAHILRRVETRSRLFRQMVSRRITVARVVIGKRLEEARQMVLRWNLHHKALQQRRTRVHANEHSVARTPSLHT